MNVMRSVCLHVYSLHSLAVRRRRSEVRERSCVRSLSSASPVDIPICRSMGLVFISSVLGRGVHPTGCVSLVSSCVEMGRGTQGTRLHRRGRSRGAPAASVTACLHREAQLACSFFNSQCSSRLVSFWRRLVMMRMPRFQMGSWGGQDTRISHVALGKPGTGGESIRPTACSRPRRAPLPRSTQSQEDRDKLLPASSSKPSASSLLGTETRHQNVSETQFQRSIRKALTQP